MKLFTNIPKLTILFLLSLSTSLLAQDGEKQQHLSLKEAIAMAKQNNKTVQISNLMKKKRQWQIFRMLKIQCLPAINAGGTYQRFSKLTLYDQGINDATLHNKCAKPGWCQSGSRCCF